jgi:hypothetical protein
MPVQRDSRKLTTIITALRSRADDVIEEIGRDIVEETQDQILTMHVWKTGATYRSVEFKLESGLKGFVIVRANRDGFRYPIRIHEGYHTPTGKYVPGRPFLRVAVENVRVRSHTKWRRLFEA